jgi:hypothetical protein
LLIVWGFFLVKHAWEMFTFKHFRTEIDPICQFWLFHRSGGAVTPTPRKPSAACIPAPSSLGETTTTSSSVSKGNLLTIKGNVWHYDVCFPKRKKNENRIWLNGIIFVWNLVRSFLDFANGSICRNLIFPSHCSRVAQPNQANLIWSTNSAHHIRDHQLRREASDGRSVVAGLM